MNKLFLILLGLGITSTSIAEVVVPKVIASHMVLQRGASAPVWGWAGPGEEVTVSFAGQVKKAMPDAKGKWMVRLDPMPASAESRVMTIQGANLITLQDVLVGEVWLASGQSNMEWSLAQVAQEEQVFAATQISNTVVRVFHVDQHITAGMPLDDTTGRWRMCSDILAPPMRSTSAVGFFFGLKLHQELGVPVALIDANWGGQRIEPFIPDVGYESAGLKLRKHPSNGNPKAIANQLKAISASVNLAIQAAEAGRKIPFLTGDRVYGHAENGIYNAMIAPVVPYAITGAIWYQGESNRVNVDYFQKLQALSAGWSTVFGVENIPFYQVQIAPFAYSRRNPNDDMLCNNIWAAQYKGAAEIPGMGVVAIHDTKIDIHNIHPVYKRPVGERLAAQALKNQYGKEVVTTGPRVAGAVLSGSKVIVSFTDIDQGLSTIDGLPPSWFEVSADGKSFVKADAVISGNTVEVSSATVPAPAQVRMGWKDIAIPNLQDKNGWPAFSFPAQPVSKPNL